MEALLALKRVETREKQLRLHLAAGPGSSIQMLVGSVPWKADKLPGFTEEVGWRITGAALRGVQGGRV